MSWTSPASDFVRDYCERELDPLLTPVTVDPAHPFPRVINKALCQALLLKRRRRSAVHLHGSDHGSAGAAPAGAPALAERHFGLHRAGGPGGGACRPDVSRLRHSFGIGLSHHPQQQSLPAGGRVAQRAGVGAHGAAQPAQGRRGAAGDRGRRQRRDHRTPARQLRPPGLAGVPHRGPGQSLAPDAPVRRERPPRPEVQALHRRAQLHLSRASRDLFDEIRRATSCCIIPTIPTTRWSPSSKPPPRTPACSRSSRRCTAPASTRPSCRRW